MYHVSCRHLQGGLAWGMGSRSCRRSAGRPLIGSRTRASSLRRLGPLLNKKENVLSVIGNDPAVIGLTER